MSMLEASSAVLLRLPHLVAPASIRQRRVSRIQNLHRVVVQQTPLLLALRLIICANGRTLEGRLRLALWILSQIAVEVLYVAR